MRHDPGSNNYIATVFRSQSVAAADAYTDNVTSTIDHGTYPFGAFLIDVSSVGTGGKVDAKIQYSDDDATYTDEDGNSGNDTAITQITAAGSAILKIPNPQGRYSRVAIDATTDACTVNVTFVGTLKGTAAD